MMAVGFQPTSIAQELSAESLKDFLRISKMESVTIDEAQRLFSDAIRDPLIRMDRPNGESGRDGLCLDRANHFQRWLQEKNVTTAKLFMLCSGYRIVAKDPVSGMTYKYRNYHTANVIHVQDSSSRSQLYVLDGQFSEAPMRLDKYLKTILPTQFYYRYSRFGEVQLPSHIEDPCVWYIESEETSTYDFR